MLPAPRKLSLFAQRMQNKKLKLEHTEESEPIINPVEANNRCFGGRSNILTGSDAKSIHEENIEKLVELSPVQIEEERRKLLATLDPSIVEFLKSKKLSTKPSAAPSSDAQNLIHSQMDFSEASDIANTPASGLVNRFPNMDRVELEKLKWMEEVPPPLPPGPGMPYNARFSFDGDLLGYAEEGAGEGLHHHGEEAARPGYTLPELMQLSRSSVLQQRVTAVATLANIFHKAPSYDRYLSEPLLPQLLDSEMFLLLRFTLDDGARSVVCTATAALAALIADVRDEGCLDRLLGLSGGLRQPSMFVQLDLKPEEEAELKDTEMLKVDVVKGALRTHMLPRFRYILEKMDPEPAEVGHLSRCLIRIARHSHDAAVTVSNEPRLLAILRTLLGEPPPLACSDSLKLFRVLACRSRQLALHLVNTYNIIEPIQRFIAGNYKETTMSLVLESFYTWQALLLYHLTVDHVSSFSPVIQRLLLAHAESTSLSSAAGDLEHACALVSWSCVAMRAPQHGDTVRAWLPALRLCAIKWISQAAQTTNIKWAACKLLDAVFQLMAMLIDTKGLKDAEVEQKVGTFLSSDSFRQAAQKMRSRSWLLHGGEGAHSLPVVESLPSLGVIPPTLYDDSPFPLLLGLAIYVYASRSPQLSVSLAMCEGVQAYAAQVVVAGARPTAAHWFARQEILLIYTLLQIHLNTQTPVNSSLLHRAALFLTTSVHADDRYMLARLFRQVIFNRHFLQPDISDVTEELQKLKLNSHNNESEACDERKVKLLNEALDSLQTTCGCYLMQLGLGDAVPPIPPSTLTASFRGTEPALPADWPYLPVVLLNNAEGSRCSDVVESESGTSVAASCLQWTLALECLRPLWFRSLSPAARFCRLACVLLAGNDLFRDVMDLLRENLKALLVHNEELDFTKPIAGLQSFYDFYRQMLEQFVGVSYGDAVFGQFVLVPLQQRFDSRFRKLVWFELAAVLRFLSTPADRIGVPIKHFLEPCETDPDLLFIYLKALGQGRIRETFCPVLYRVAVHHVATFVSQNVEHTVAKQLSHLIANLGNQELKNKLRSYCSET